MSERKAALDAIAVTSLVALVFVWAAGRGIPLFVPDRTLRGGLLAGTLFAAEFACCWPERCCSARR